jgi:RNA polymerase sigma-70 factor (ECF subfamily)
MSAGMAAVEDFAEGRIRCWVERARKGDVGAFEALYREHVGRIHALCRRLCRDESEAEEMTQDAFVRAWERLDSFRGDSAFGSWLHRLTVNVVLTAWRSRQRYRERVLALDDFEGFDAAGPLSPEGAGLDLERAIDGLPTGARTIFVLHDIEGYRHGEIGEMTGLAEGTCKAQLHRARNLLRKALGYATNANDDRRA